jgi:hypothetical protein
MPTLAIFQLYCGIKSIYLMLFYRLLLPGSIIEDGREEAKYDTDKVIKESFYLSNSHFTVANYCKYM